MRYEDDFGSYWTVDDGEFLKRRHLSRGRPRKYNNLKIFELIEVSENVSSIFSASGPLIPPTSVSPFFPTTGPLDLGRLVSFGLGTESNLDDRGKQT